jgi:Methyltransferase domain
MLGRMRQLLTGNLRAANLQESKSAIAAYRGLRRSLDRIGLQVVAKSFYSPIPDLRRLPAGTWERQSDLVGIELDLDRQLEFLEAELAGPLGEFDPSPELLTNQSYGPVDAGVLYAMVRALKPRQIVELGSGYTSLVIARACVRNTEEGSQARYRAFDPYPGVADPPPAGLDELVPAAAQDVPREVFDQLAAGDVLVVDTTHTVKTGGDVNRIVLEVLPALLPGVVVHFHDIFLPWEYPRIWAEEYGLYWSEQYLLQAFLALNPEFEVICALHALSREHPDRLRDIVPSWNAGAVPGAFWIRRRPAR